MTISPGQCRAARALLGWTQKQLEERSRVTQKTITDFERGVRQPFPRTLDDIVQAFEEAGMRFIAPQDGVNGQGLMLAWGVEPAQRLGGDEEDDAGRRGRSTQQALPGNQDLRGLYDYWCSRPDEWRELSTPSRHAVLREIFGDLPEGDPVIEGIVWSGANAAAIS